ncbi:MAG: extracellular solute-binding protein [Roseburia sp.]|nr:extracellular solute-binding protein [Roseburia sp.]
MRNSVKKWGVGIAVFAAIVTTAVLLPQDKVTDFHEKYEGTDLTSDIKGMERAGTYIRYIAGHDSSVRPQENVNIELFDYTSAKDVERYTSYEGVDEALYTGVDSTVTWQINVPQSGYYNLYTEYLIPESRGVVAERIVYINGEIPFESARNITFSRIWTDGGEVKVDNQGNEIRPTQKEVFAWQKAYFRDDRGYEAEPYLFYFEKGINELTLEAENEPMILKSLELKSVQDMDDYQAYLEKQPGVNMTETGTSYQQIVQGEDSTLRSESSLYAKYDRSSPTTQPNSVTNTVLNYVGGEAWRSAGQWIEWNFEVPEDGYYNLMIKARQNYARGSISSRSVYIDGEIPFSEMKEISFEYENDWNCMTLTDEEGTPYQFYLKEGTHTLRLEATLGGVGSILEELEDSIYRLNQIYRKLLIYTGVQPDKYRDYNIQQVYPEVIEAMDLESKRLYKIVDEMVAYSGQKADNIATAQTVAQQLERFVKNPNKITLEFTTFKDNITALGTASLNMSATKLDVDYFVVSGINAPIKVEKAGAMAKAWHEMKSFAASFVVDYDAVGDVYEEGDEGVIKVWILTGRDQGTILKSMVDDTFTPDTGIKVNVEIVAADALLNAVVAGRGPNVVLSVGADQPVNYALRNAAEDLSQFSDLQDVLSHYTASSYEQYRLDDHIYGIPETQNFNVMFYRKDVLEELGLEIPNTWQELIEMLPTIQGNNMTIAIPTAAGSSATASASTSVASNTPDLSMYFSLLYQYGGDMYNEAGTRTVVNSEAGVQAFDDYVRYFNDYGTPTIYDFVSRFRSGEMPIGIASYSIYNTLMVSAPEIRGLWDFTLIPGTETTDGNGRTYIDRSDFITGSATMMVKTEDEQLRNNSWEFMKWWADADTQVRFGREIEALLGSSARYATANKDAFVQLAWSADDIAVLNDQWDQTVGIREVPGGYYTGRHITNAIRKVINEKDDPRETIIDYSIKIDEEITKKRIEFGLPVD